MKHKYLLISMITVAGLIIKHYLKKHNISNQLLRQSLNKNVPDTNPLKNKRIAFLGSSITMGHASHGFTFADIMKFRDGIKLYKHAISGTTLAGKNPLTYVNRMKYIMNTNRPLDLFVIQLSTNDQRTHESLGHISSSFDIKDFDIKTTIDAMEYIIQYVRKYWNCPIMFYTCLHHNEKSYGKLVDVLYELQRKWHFSILDLYNNRYLNYLVYPVNNVYMHDEIHPTLRGYQVITPFFEKKLKNIFRKK